MTKTGGGVVDENGNGLYRVKHDDAKIFHDGYTEAQLKGFQQSELRYAGPDPNNYVTFNGEEAGWRIIGLVNVKTTSGTVEQRLKLIKANSIGEYSWDYKPDGNSRSYWTKSTLMSLLNSGEYYNRTTGYYYNDSTSPIEVDFSTTGLLPETKNMIEEVTWNLGGWENTSITTSKFYNYERRKVDHEIYPSEWRGKIGLMYPSDYGYAVGGNTNNRNTCLTETELKYYKSGCKNYDWLSTGSKEWLLPPKESSINHEYAISLDSGGGLYQYSNVIEANVVRPTIYLSKNVVIEGNVGSQEEPFTLSVVE